jgi:hypothetical protein
MGEREWHRFDEAAPTALEQLKSVAPIELPESYLSFLSQSNGGEGPLPVQPYWLQLYSAEEVIEIEKSETFHAFFPGFFVIGGNGSGEAIALDFRAAEPYPLVAFDMTNSSLAESVRLVAKSFDEAMDLIGLVGT